MSRDIVLKKQDLLYQEKLTIRRALEVYAQCVGDKKNKAEYDEAERLGWLIKDASVISVYTEDMG